MDEIYIDKSLAEVGELEELVAEFVVSSVLDKLVVWMLVTWLEDGDRVDVDLRVVDWVETAEIVDDSDEETYVAVDEP